jgi:hypothetical protein
MPPKKLSPRALRRERDRVTVKLARNVERLYRVSPGGAPDHPIPLQAASQVETHATANPCPLCQGLLRLDDHSAETIKGSRLRVAHVSCASCGARRALYFRIGSELAS